MPVLELNVTISTEDFPRLMNAVRSAFPKPENRELTNEECVAGLRQYGINQMKALVRNYERAQAMKAAEAFEPTLEVS